jgi:hypothetical protein
MKEYGIQRAVRAALEGEGDARRRTILSALLAHLDATRRRDVEARVATLTEDFSYFYWRDGKNVGPTSKAAARRLYEATFASKTDYDLKTEHIVVSDDCVVTEGEETLLLNAEGARLRGLPVEDPDETWTKTFRSCILWRFEPGTDLLQSVSAYMSPFPTDPTGWSKLA